MKHTTQAASAPAAPASTGHWRLSYLWLGLSVLALLGARGYAAWADAQAHAAQLPKSGMAAVAAALRTFHQQTGRFPPDFRALDGRVWGGTKEPQISADGLALTAPASHYYYRLQVTNPPLGAASRAGLVVGLWGVPLGPRASEAATYFWRVTPDVIESWQGPALTAANVSAVRGMPTEQELALLVMTRQNPTRPAERSSGSFFNLFW